MLLHMEEVTMDEQRDARLRGAPGKKAVVCSDEEQEEEADME